MFSGRSDRKLRTNMRLQSWIGRSCLPRTLLAAALFSTLLPASCAQSTPHIVVDFSKTFQTIDGWEVTPRLWEYDKSNNRYDGAWLQQKDEIARKLVDEAGITRVRLELRSGIENPVDYWAMFAAGKLSYLDFKSRFYEKINDNEDPSVANPAGFQWSQLDHYATNFAIPLRDAMAARGERLRVNLCYVDFRWTDKKGTLSHADQSEEYAEIVTLAVQRLKEKFGLEVDMVEVILEPDNSDRWSGESIGRGAVAAKKRLSAADCGGKQGRRYAQRRLQGSRRQGSDPCSFVPPV